MCDLVVISYPASKLQTLIIVGNAASSCNRLSKLITMVTRSRHQSYTGDSYYPVLPDIRYTDHIVQDSISRDVRVTEIRSWNRMYCIQYHLV